MNVSLKHALRAAAIALVLLAPSAPACLNDRDTLALEAKKKPEALMAITGRFERNPPLYYEMRIARVAKDLQARPNNLDEYDDIAVACDRLSRDDEAIAWMGRKRAHLAPLSSANASLTEEWYKYYANIGTARIHRWLRAGGDRAKITEVRQARDEIARAVKIKPEAHFGREKYQLGIMKWILDSCIAIKHRQTPYALSFTDSNDDDPNIDEDAVTGLSGLVTLGNAWESVDVFHALSVSLGQIMWPSSFYVNHLQSLALARIAELRREGKKSLFPESPIAAPEMVAADGRAEKEFARLRAEADRWQKTRTDYMMARLTAGRHPDTDRSFWSQYQSAPPPDLDDDQTKAEKRAAKIQKMEPVAAMLVAAILAAILAARIVRSWSRKLPSKPAPE